MAETDVVEQEVSKIEQYLGKFVSRKLAVMLGGTVLLVTGHLTGDQWMALALGYIGIEGCGDLAIKWKASGGQNVTKDNQVG